MLRKALLKLALQNPNGSEKRKAYMELVLASMNESFTPERLNNIAYRILRQAEHMGIRVWENHDIDFRNPVFTQTISLDTKSAGYEAEIAVENILEKTGFKPQGGVWKKEGLSLSVEWMSNGARLIMKCPNPER